MDMQHRSDCKKSVSLHSGIFFEQSRLQLWLCIVLMYWWAREYSVTDAAEKAEVDKKTAIQIYQYCQEICSWRLRNHDSPLMLSGNAVVVQIDKSLLCHKPKHQRGRATTNEVRVFGLCDTSQFPALGAMCIVPDCSAQTLLSIITQHVRLGTVIHSNQWVAYNQVH